MAEALKARVENGRLKLDTPTDLPEGTEVELQAVNDNDWTNEETWSQAERDRLETALEKGSADIAAGRMVDAREFLAKLSEQP